MRRLLMRQRLYGIKVTKHHELGAKRAARHFRQIQLKDVTGWGAVRCRHHTPQLVGMLSRQEVADSTLGTAAESAAPKIRAITYGSVAAEYQRVAPAWFIDQVNGDFQIGEDLPEPAQVIA